MAIDVSKPYSDGWWLNTLYMQLRDQQKHAQAMHDRYRGQAPLPPMNPRQAEAVRWFIGKARTNFEKLIVAAVLSRLRIRGIRTAADNDEGGDAEAFKKWKKTRGKTWTKDVHKYALSMGCGYAMVGRHPDTDKLLVTAEDPRQCTVITDPADPLRVIAGMKLIYDPVESQDVVYLFLIDHEDPGRFYMRIARREAYRSSSGKSLYGKKFDAEGFTWANLAPPNLDDPKTVVETYEPEWLQASGDRPALCPIVMFENEDGMAEFEPHLEILDRITQQILQRMTIATIQAFKQRAMKGLPKNDPETGDEIDYNEVFLAEPGAIWNIPASVDIWESGAVDLQPILLSIRDDIKDLAAVSGTPLYTVTPDVANGSAEGASLQREQLTFKVEDRQDRWEIQHGMMCELIFRADKDEERSDPESNEIIWAPGDRPSMSERANAIAQTRGTMPRYMQLTEIWGMDPNEADRAMTLLNQDMVIDKAMAPTPGGGVGPPQQQQQQKQLKPSPPKASSRVKGLPDVTKTAETPAAAS